MEVSGERLSAVATDNSLLFGLNGIYRQGRFSIGAEIAARQELGSNDSEYASFLNVGIRFNSRVRRNSEAECLSQSHRHSA